MKNTHDSQEAVHLMNRTQLHCVGHAKRKVRQLLREWAVSNRPDYGKNSIREYCRVYTTVNETRLPR